MRNSFWRAARAILVSAAFASTGHAQMTVDRNVLPERLEPATRTTLVHLADSLRALGLPVTPLYAKAAEGTLKGATDQRILVAVRALAGELIEARSALGVSADEATLVAGASALHAGVPSSVILSFSRMREGAQDRGRLAGALVALSDLVVKKVPVNAAAGSIESLLQRRATDDDFAALRMAVERDVSTGRSPEAAINSRAQALMRELDARRPPQYPPPARTPQ